MFNGVNEYFILLVLHIACCPCNSILLYTVELQRRKTKHTCLCGLHCLHYNVTSGLTFAVLLKELAKF